MGGQDDAQFIGVARDHAAGARQLVLLRIPDLAQHVDAGPWESLWVYDHFHTVPAVSDEATHEAWTLMAAYAATTSRVRLGQMCTCMSYRNPAYLAKVAATVDISSWDNGIIRVTGGGSRMGGLNEVLGAQFGARVERLDPFRRVRLPARLDAEQTDAAPHAAVAVGLALRKVGDR